MPQEQQFESISHRVPSFGGFFIQGGRLVVYLTDLSDSAPLRPMVEDATVKQRAVFNLDFDVTPLLAPGIPTDRRV